MTDDQLLTDLRAATAGSAELSARVWSMLTGAECVAEFDLYLNRMRILKLRPDGFDEQPCITTSLDAAWRVAEERGYSIAIEGRTKVDDYCVASLNNGKKGVAEAGYTAALALVAALVVAVAAVGEE